MSSVSSFVSTQCEVLISSADLQFGVVLLQVLETAVFRCCICELDIPESIRLASGELWLGVHFAMIC